LGWKGPLKAIPSNPSALSRDSFHWIRLLRAPSNLTHCNKRLTPLVTTLEILLEISKHQIKFVQ